MSNLSDYVGTAGGGGGSAFLRAAETITGAVGTLSLDFSGNNAYIITQGNADLTLQIDSAIDARNEGVLLLQRNFDYNLTYADAEVFDLDGILPEKNFNYTGDSFYIGNENGNENAYGLIFINGGAKVLLTGTQFAADIHQYSLSNPYDITTMSYDNVAFSVASQEPNPTGIEFNNDGTKLYVCGYSNDTLYQYTLTTPFDILTATYDNVFLGLFGTAEMCVRFNNDGSKMFTSAGDTARIYPYTLTTPFDISTATYDNIAVPFSVDSFVFNGDGSVLYTVSADNDLVREYSLSIPFDITTNSLVASYDVSAQDPAPSAIIFDNSFFKFYILGRSNDTIYEYEIPKTVLGVHVHGTHKTLTAEYNL